MEISVNRELYDHVDNVKIRFKTAPGLTEEVVRQISAQKNEPEWMLKHRLHCFEVYQKLKVPKWGPDLSKLDMDKITYYIEPDAIHAKSWEQVDPEVKRTFDKLGIPEAEQRALAGVGAQFDSDVVYHNIKKELSEKGVIFEDCDVALKEYPELFKKYFMKCVPATLHKYAALHGAVWSGGTFLYVPKGVEIKQPLQAYFRMNSKSMGQFEHTLIIIEEGAKVHYIEGCSAPKYNTNSIHAGCVEVFAKKDSRVRYSSVENWSINTYNLNTKRAMVEEGAHMEWVGGNLGSGVTMLYPCSMLVGKNSSANHISIAFAAKGQNQDTGAKVFHIAPNTSSKVVSKSISVGGITSYRGIVQIGKGAENSKSSVKCDALIRGIESKSNSFPHIDVNAKEADVGHEASVGRINEDMLFYIMSRGIGEEQAMQIIVGGFIEPVIRELPLEYAVEMNKLIQMGMEGSVG
ncbi:MAG TPA: Fe-S cluster assembly protein SufB [Candidatus Nanoarchaeia archaeon]|nr:Fe-S cluster assembly protein SufB [Candidatus Nanoarchaeia archaeon]